MCFQRRASIAALRVQVDDDHGRAAPLSLRKEYETLRTHPYTTAACAAGVVTKTTDRDSLRYTYNGTRRVRQLALGCESN